MPITQYLVLDAARCGVEVIEHAQSLCAGQQDCLYLLNPENHHLHVVAPYVFSLNEGLRAWYLQNGWAVAWGIVLVSDSDFDRVRLHLRRFLKILTEDQNQLYFRFYDPRVLKIFLPTCEKGQIVEFFGPVDYFVVEGDTKEEAIKFWHQNGILQQKKVPVEEVFDRKVPS